MSWLSLLNLVRTARAFDYLRTTLSVEQATTALKKRVAEREDTFLRLAQTHIYGNSSSPYRRLLLWAGCEKGDLEQSTRAHGLEATLARLRDAGVYISHEEFEGIQPICRSGLTLHPAPDDFDNPWIPHTKLSYAGSTSGTRSQGKRVFHSWDLLSEVAANELVVYETHHVVDAPVALWFPIPPSLAGITHVLTNIKFGRPPERWFSQLHPSETPAPFLSRLATECLVWSGRLKGQRIPQPEPVRIQQAEQVAAWMADTKKTKGTSVVRTYVSSAVRIAEAAMSKGYDIDGCFLFVGGEPLTERRHAYIAATGARVYARYVMTELNLVAASCAFAEGPGDMHFFMDRLAVIQHPRSVPKSAAVVEAFLFTSLSPYSPKVAFNTEFGDFGALATRPCPCLLGQLGLVQHMSGVASHDKLTGEGMTILGTELDSVIETLIVEAGGCPDDYQFWEQEEPDGLTQLVLALSPKIYDALGDRIRAEVLNRLPTLKGGATASLLWQQAGTVKVIRSHPVLSKGGKMTPILPRSQQPSG